MPHAGRFKLWDDTPESQAAARRYSHNFLKKYALEPARMRVSQSCRIRLDAQVMSISGRPTVKTSPITPGPP